MFNDKTKAVANLVAAANLLEVCIFFYLLSPKDALLMVWNEA